jgi:hypothetical protein
MAFTIIALFGLLSNIGFTQSPIYKEWKLIFKDEFYGNNKKLKKVGIPK